MSLLQRTAAALSGDRTGKTDLNLDQIRTDGGTQPRAAIDLEVVAEYAEVILSGRELPAVTVYYDGKDYWLADGFHRWHAHKKADKRSILADVRQGAQRDAVLYSAGANAEHGLRRTNEDKRRAVLRLLEDSEWQEKGSGWIAEKCHVSDRFVRKVRSEMGLSRNDSGIREVRRGDSVYRMDVGRISAVSGITDDEREIFDAHRGQEVVYVLSNGSEYKIGFTNDLERRYKDSHGNNPRVRLIHAFAASATTERTLHRMLSEYRADKEWFKLPDQMIDWLLSIEDGDVYKRFGQTKRQVVDDQLSRFEALGWIIVEHSLDRASSPAEVSWRAIHHRRQVATREVSHDKEILLWDLEGERFNRENYSMVASVLVDQPTAPTGKPLAAAFDNAAHQTDARELAADAAAAEYQAAQAARAAEARRHLDGWLTNEYRIPADALNARISTLRGLDKGKTAGAKFLTRGALVYLDKVGVSMDREELQRHADALADELEPRAKTQDARLGRLRATVAAVLESLEDEDLRKAAAALKVGPAYGQAIEMLRTVRVATQ